MPADRVIGRRLASGGISKRRVVKARASRPLSYAHLLAGPSTNPPGGVTYAAVAARPPSVRPAGPPGGVPAPEVGQKDKGKKTMEDFWVLESCNTTDLDGRPLVILIRFRRNDEEGLFVKTWLEQGDNHIDIIREWATAYNQGQLCVANRPPFISLPMVKQIRTCIMIAPYHRSKNDSFVTNEPAHISVLPSGDYFRRGRGAVDGRRWHGAYGAIHIYANRDATANNVRRYSGYRVSQRRPNENNDWDSDSERGHLHFCIKNMRLYNGQYQVADNYTNEGKTMPSPGTRTAPGAVATSSKNTCPKVGWTAEERSTWSNSMTIPGLEGEQWLVSSIINCTVISDKGTKRNPGITGLHYQVDWTGWPPDTSWYPAKNFKGCPVKLDEFHNRNPNVPRRPRNLINWHVNAATGRNASSRRNDNQPEPEPEPRPVAPVLHS